MAFDENSSYKRGSALAPQRIREAFFCDSSNLWTENETYLGADGLFADAGDITPSAERMPIETEQAAGKLYEAGLKVMAFGGDHSVTYPLVKAATKYHSNLTILHFDAHLICTMTLKAIHTHASPFAKIAESGWRSVSCKWAFAPSTDISASKPSVSVWMCLPCKIGRMFSTSASTRRFTSPSTWIVSTPFAPGSSHREPGGLVHR
ncbi:MAG: arginase family protein [Anaerolineales bacterium]|nr:arginase family protein [Anaerolineales bacterium]